MPKSAYKIAALREVLDDMEILTLLSEEERAGQLFGITEQLNTLSESPAKEAAECLYFYLSTGEERELIQAKELVISLLSVYD